jgi:hypothetical protein
MTFRAIPSAIDQGYTRGDGMVSAVIILLILAQEAEKQVLMANGWASMSLPDINDREGHTRIVELFKKAMGVLPNAYPSRPGAWVMKTQVSQ